MLKKKITKREPLDYYLGLKYPITFYPDAQKGYVIEIKDLPGCMTQAETVEEAMENIEEARSLWIETAYEFEDDIPLPSTDRKYSGKLRLTIPKTLHRNLAKNAEKEGVRLNQYILSLLSEKNAIQLIGIETAYKFGDDIPLPSTDRKYIQLTIPKTLHRNLAENAEKEGVRLNQYILALLSENNAIQTMNLENF